MLDEKLAEAKKTEIALMQEKAALEKKRKLLLTERKGWGWGSSAQINVWMMLMARHMMGNYVLDELTSCVFDCSYIWYQAGDAKGTQQQPPPSGSQTSLPSGSQTSMPTQFPILQQTAGIIDIKEARATMPARQRTNSGIH